MAVPAPSQLATRKSLRGHSADLLAHFSSKEPPVFTVREAADFLGADRQRVNTVLSRLARQGWITRIRRNIYEVAPSWSQPEAPYLPDRYAAIAQWLTPPYYVGFRSALEIHNALLQPISNRVYVVVANRRRVLKSTTEPIEWIIFPAPRFEWGLTTHWIGSRRLAVSDWERTILDGLHLPRRIGGIAEVAGALARYPDRMSPSRLVDYVKRYGLVSVMKRLGWLLERVAPSQAEAVTGDLLKAFPASRQRTPTLLDPSLPETGPLDETWKVIVNVADQDLVSSIKS